MAKRLIDATIRLRGVSVYREEDRDNPWNHERRWQVPIGDEDQDAFLQDLGYPQRIAAEDLGDLIIMMAGLNNTVVFEPGTLEDPERYMVHEPPTVGNEVV